MIANSRTAVEGAAILARIGGRFACAKPSSLIL
jgi:hypothetical protein